MPGFFPIKKNRKPLLTITDFTEVMQYILGAMYFLSLIKPANGDICFEINNQDYTLSCSRDEGKIFSLLQAGAGAYKDSADDCARYFIEELNFCHGLLAGTVCDLKYHDFNVPDPTAIDIIKANCKDGYGTSADIIITIAIAVGALLVTAITACLLVKACKTRPNQAINEVNEASFILEEIIAFMQSRQGRNDV